MTNRDCDPRPASHQGVQDAPGAVSRADWGPESIEAITPLLGLPGAVARSASELVVERIALADATRLNHLWHSVLPDIDGLGFGDTRLAFGALFDNGCYGVAIWTRPVAANRMSLPVACLLELRRLAIPEYSPKFTATRMLGKMSRWIRQELPDVCRLLSYQVTDLHSGTIYKAANWTPTNRQDSYQDWTTGTRKRKPGQNLSPKVRWELQIRDHKH